MVQGVQRSWGAGVKLLISMEHVAYSHGTPFYRSPDFVTMTEDNLCPPARVYSRTMVGAEAKRPLIAVCKQFNNPNLRRAPES